MYRVSSVYRVRPSRVMSILLDMGAPMKSNHPTRSLKERLVSTYEPAKPPRSLLRKALGKIPFLNIDQIQMKAVGYLLYESVVDNLDYVGLFERFDLPDTFYSWFALTELYLWMLSTRAMAEGAEEGAPGRLVRNSMLEALWTDVGIRVKKLGAGNPSGMRRRIQELSEQLQAALIAYDEGLQSDDVVLAGAIWRRVYQMDAADPEHLEGLVGLVRRQIQLLDNTTWDDLTVHRKLTWLPPPK